MILIDAYLSNSDIFSVNYLIVDTFNKNILIATNIHMYSQDEQSKFNFEKETIYLELFSSHKECFKQRQISLQGLQQILNQKEPPLLLQSTSLDHQLNLQFNLPENHGARSHDGGKQQISQQTLPDSALSHDEQFGIGKQQKKQLIQFHTSRKNRNRPDSRKLKNKIIKIRNRNIKKALSIVSNQFYIKKQCVQFQNRIKQQFNIKDPTKSHGYFFMCLSLLAKYKYSIDQFIQVFDKTETIKKNKKTMALNEEEEDIIREELKFTKQIISTFYQSKLDAILYLYMRNHDYYKIKELVLPPNILKSLAKTVQILDMIFGTDSHKKEMSILLKKFQQIKQYEPSQMMDQSQ